MATSQVNPSNLKIGRCKEVVVAHLFLFFETRNLKKRDELIWRVDMLFGREGQPLLCVSVFDKVTNLLHDKLEPLSGEPKAMVATNINPKFAGGKTATLFMFCGGGDGSLTTSKDGGVKKLESVTFQEINSYFHNSTPHVHPLSKAVEFLCKAEVADTSHVLSASSFIDSHLLAALDSMMTMQWV
ncbi:hypothetical protein Bca4012_072218 [Brassica carinata]